MVPGLGQQALRTWGLDGDRSPHCADHQQGQVDAGLGKVGAGRVANLVEGPASVRHFQGAQLEEVLGSLAGEPAATGEAPEVTSNRLAAC